MGRVKLEFNLTLKVLLIIVCILLLTIGVNTFVNVNLFYHDYEAALIDRGFIICSTLRFQLMRLLFLGIPVNNIVGFEEQCLDAVSKYNLAYAMIVDDKDTILFHNEIKEHGKIYFYKIKKSSKLFNIVMIKNALFYEIALPVFMDNQKVASVKIGFSKKQVSGKIGNHIFNTVIVSIIFFIFSSTLLFILISTWVTVPIKRLTNTIKDIRNENNLDAKVLLKSKDEIGELGDSFNALILKLNKYQSRIKKYNEVLEKKVKIRTSELEENKKELENDIAIRKKIEQKLEKYTKELERSNHDLEQFAYIASHDLQEPLRMVSSYLQLIKRRYADKLDSDADEFFSYAYDGAIRMQELINALLLYSRANVKEKNIQAVDMNDILKKVEQNLKIAVEENGAVITSDELPRIKADPIHIMQLFQNLISNAIKFKKEKSVLIHVGFEKKDGEWIFSVKDNGIGFDVKHVEKIFQIFQRLHNKEEYKGTGIGLAICKKIVERHGGKIWAESEVNKGSVFYFSIPITNLFS